MGQKDETKPILSESQTLIDFLYIDNERVDSLISQLRQGTLRSVTKTIGASEGSSVSAGLTAPILGTYEHKNQSNETASEKYDPYHNKLIQLLNDLEIPFLKNFTGDCSGKLVAIEAPIKIRDLHSTKSIMPVILKNQRLLFKTPNKNNKDALAVFKFANDILQQTDDSIDLSISCGDTKINGTLKESGLSIKQSDLARTYGTSMPGRWVTVGILDSTRNNQDAGKTALTPVGIDSIDSAIDAFTEVMRNLYANSPYTIIPIIIYRAICY